MNINTELAKQYAEFLEGNSRGIQTACDELGNMLCAAVQCMDQESGRNAARRLAQDIDTIKSAVPISDDACQRLILALKCIMVAGDIFRR